MNKMEKYPLMSYLQVLLHLSKTWKNFRKKKLRNC